MDISLQIEHLDESVMRTLQQLAQEQHVSVEEIVRRHILELSRDRERKKKHRHKNEIIREHAGRWSAADLEEFEHNTAPFREIDPTLWK